MDLQARSSPENRQYAVSAALIARDDSHQLHAWLLDATPDVKEQLDLLERLAPGCKLQVRTPDLKQSEESNHLWCMWRSVHLEAPRA